MSDYLSLNGKVPAGSILELISSDGRIVLKIKVVDDDRLNVSSLLPGLYIAKATHPNGRPISYDRLIKN